MNKQVYVTFGDRKTELDFESLKKGKYENKKLYEFINRAIKDLKNNPSSGIKIPKKLWPRTYKNII